MSEARVHAVVANPEMANRSDAPLRAPKPSIRAIQVILGLLWIVAGALQFQPFMFSQGFVSQIIAPVAQGQPIWIGRSITWSAAVMSHHLVFYNAVFATTQVLIGVALLFRRSVRIALLVSFAWALSVWWFGEGLGMIPMGMASPLTGAPGAVLLYGLVGALVWPARPDTTKVELGNETEPRDRAAGWTAPAGRIVWAGLWFMAAVLWLLPANRSANSIHDQILTAPYGWLGSTQHALANASSGSGFGIAVALALGSIAIGVGVFFPATVRPALVLGALLSLAYWALGQSFGLLTTGTATDVNAGPLFVLLALRLWIDPVRINWLAVVPRTQPRGIGLVDAPKMPAKITPSNRVPVA